jgi:phage shock protein PspC (stress-responsive transcriptional regulator)
VLVSAGLMWFWLRYFVWAPYQRVGGSNVLAVSLMCTAIAAALLATLIVPGPSSKARLRARWRGRWLQGICVGLAEYLGVSVWLIRAALLTLLLTGNYGGTLYFMLAFVVPLHPDDRQHLTGFRLQRWWRARRAA